MFDITWILEIIIAVAVIVMIPYLKNKVGASQLATTMQYVKIAVEAAEQLYKESGQGPLKKEYVLKWLADRKIKVDMDKIDAMIEAAVYNLHSGVLIAEPINDPIRDFTNN